VNKQIPSYLKLVTDTITEAPAASCEDLAALEHVCQAFELATGWRLEYAVGPIPSTKSNLMWSAPVDPGVGASPGHIRLLFSEVLPSDVAPRIALEQIEPLADALGKMWGELLAARHALRQREAELATGVPLVLHEDDAAPRLGEQLEAVLRGGAEAIGCQAAALYLLDPATTELKLRSSWGLPLKRLADPARPLRGALADLEALMGHAVVLTDAELHDYWKVPEKTFRSCVCVPVSSPTMPLGTLWAFCGEARDFSDAQTNIWEVVAGRLAADLERRVLVDEALAARDQTKQITAAQRSQEEQLPRIAPLVEGWEIAAKAYHAGPVGGTFYDWFARDDGGLAVVAGDALQRGVEGALTASALRTAARALGTQCEAAHVLLEKTNAILWTGSAGDSGAGLFQAIVTPAAAAIEFSAAGPIRVLTIGADGHLALTGPSAPLGLHETLRTSSLRPALSPGAWLLAYGTTFLGDVDQQALEAMDEQLAGAFEHCPNFAAGRLIEIAGDVLQAYPALDGTDRVLALIKRRRP
jgi:sigma-B regulation protein RsbU (phosphoserine phosphatase)